MQPFFLPDDSVSIELIVSDFICLIMLFLKLKYLGLPPKIIELKFVSD